MEHQHQELKFCEIDPVKLFCDDESALYLSSNPILHKMTKQWNQY